MAKGRKFILEGSWIPVQETDRGFLFEGSALLIMVK
jgi:hypothetical protein